jgi:prepilin peptidase CpaA
MNHYVVFMVLAFVFVAAVMDVLTHRIPNWLTFAFIVAGIAMNGILSGLAGVFFGIQGLALGFALLFAFYLLGGMGAGDVKLLSAVGAALGPRMAFYAFIWMALSGGCLAVIIMLARRATLQTVGNLKMLVLGWLLRIPSEEANLTIRNQSLIKLPYGVAIALGTALAVWLKRMPSLGF